MEIILFQPQIPQNTGNIVRTCAAVGASLTLVRPLGFNTGNKALKRAGLDYWTNVFIQEVDDLEDYLKLSDDPFYFFSSRVDRHHFSVGFTESTRLIFGNETEGLPSHFFDQYSDRFITIPMKENIRCLNLSNAVAVALYEGVRQQLKSKIETV